MSTETKSKKKRIRGNPLPLIVENHPEDYKGYPFITLIQYKNDILLTIIDNTTDKFICAYELDLCNAAKIDEKAIIEVAKEWYFIEGHRYPLSVEFSKRGLTPIVNEIYRKYEINYITRVVGPLMKFEINEVKNKKKRKKVKKSVFCEEK